MEYKYEIGNILMHEYLGQVKVLKKEKGRETATIFYCVLTQDEKKLWEKYLFRLADKEKIEVKTEREKLIEEIRKVDYITYKDFNEKIKKFGLKHKNVEDCLYVEVDDDSPTSTLVGIISTSLAGVINTNFDYINEMEYNQRRELLNLIVKLALTPPAQRFEIKNMTKEEIEKELGYKVNIVLT